MGNHVAMLGVSLVIDIPVSMVMRHGLSSIHPWVFRLLPPLSTKTCVKQEAMSSDAAGPLNPLAPVCFLVSTEAKFK
jgi:hypothetical protein